MRADPIAVLGDICEHAAANADRMRRSFPGLVWDTWREIPAPRLASTMPEWVSCNDCGTRRDQIATLGRDPVTHQLQACVSYCRDCGNVSTWSSTCLSSPINASHREMAHL